MAGAAKAKAAAKLAKGKAMAAKAALAQKEQAEAAAAASQTSPNSTIPSASTTAPKPRPTVTQYWADSASSAPSSGGGIQRIGYDQALYDEAVREVILEPKAAPAVSIPSETNPSIDNGTDATITSVEESKETKQKIEVKKEDVALLASEMEISVKEAEEKLRRVGGDLLKALEEATLPIISPVPPQQKPWRGSVFV